MRSSFCERIYKIEPPTPARYAPYITPYFLECGDFALDIQNDRPSISCVFICSSLPYLPPYVHIYTNVSNFEYGYIENWKWAGIQSNPLKTKRSVNTYYSVSSHHMRRIHVNFQVRLQSTDRLYFKFVTMVRKKIL